MALSFCVPDTYKSWSSLDITESPFAFSSGFICQYFLWHQLVQNLNGRPLTSVLSWMGCQVKYFNAFALGLCCLWWLTFMTRARVTFVTSIFSPGCTYCHCCRCQLNWLWANITVFLSGQEGLSLISFWGDCAMFSGTNTTAAACCCSCFWHLFEVLNTWLLSQLLSFAFVQLDILSCGGNSRSLYPCVVYIGQYV